MSQLKLSSTAIASLNLPFFEGFPYFVVRLQAAFYHLSVFPADRPLNVLRELARSQALTNSLAAGLVLARDSCFYYHPDGTESKSNCPPVGGIVVTGSLKTAEDFPETEELIARRHRLESFVKSRKQTGCTTGDLTKGGRVPSDSEVKLLTGRQPNGVPLGLQQCGQCGEWRGECIDPNTLLGGLLVRVHCLCENRDLCARCGKRLWERKVGANYYSESDHCVWHVPGFSALRHRCERGSTWQA